MDNDPHVGQQVEAVTRGFYDAIEAMVTGRGLELMDAAWHHGDQVTTKHPSGDWAKGWDEVRTTWELFASFGAPERGGGSISGLEVYVYGDIAYTTCVYRPAQKWGGELMACTNVLRRIDGEWKIVHHHADSSPAMAAALERMLEELEG